MSKETIFSSLSLINREISLLQQNLALKDSSPVAFRLRNITEHVVVGDQMQPVFKGISCDLPLSLPSEILTSASRSAYHSELLNCYSRLAAISGENGVYKPIESVREYFASCRELTLGTGGDFTLFQGSLRKSLENELSAFQTRIQDLAKEAEEKMRLKLRGANLALKDLQDTYKNMKGSSSNERAVQTTEFFQKLLCLASYFPVRVGELENGNLPSAVYLGEGKLNLLEVEQVPKVEGSMGEIAALKQFGERLDRMLSRVKELVKEIKGEISGRDISQFLEEGARMQEEEWCFKFQSLIDEQLSDVAAERRIELAENDALELRKLEREQLMLSREECDLRVSTLMEQRDMLFKLLTLLADFGKQIVKLNLF